MAHKVRHSVCPSSKKRKYRTVRDAERGARALARWLNRFGILAQDMYVYTCPDCRTIHLTRSEQHHGDHREPIFVAPSEELQRWAMGLAE